MELENTLNFVMVCFGMMLTGASYSIPTPIFPQEALDRGVSVSQSGIVIGSAYLATFIFTPFCGVLIGKFGIRRLFLAGVFITGVGNILFGFLSYIRDGTLYFVLSLAIRVFTALGESIVAPTAYPLGSNQVSEANKGKATSIVESCFGIGTVFGPVLGGFLYDLGGFGFPFWLSGFIAIFTCLFTSCFLKDKPKEIETSIREIGWWDVLKCKGILVYAIGTALGGSCLAWWQASLEPYLYDNFQLDSKMTGLIITGNSVTYTFLAPLFGLFIDRGLSSFHAVCIGNMITMVAMLLLGPVPGLESLHNIPAIVTAMVLLGLGTSSGLIGGLLGLMECSQTNKLPQTDQTHSLMSSLWLISLCIGSFVGAGLGSVTFDQFGFSWSCSIEAVIIGVSVLLFCGCETSRRARRKIEYQQI